MCIRDSLLLIPTFSEGKNGYLTSLGKEKPTPVRLQLKPEDKMKYAILKENFTPARFDESQSGQESFIVSSIGQYLITWSLKHIITGKKFDYDIKKLPDKIVSNEFKFNAQDSLYVALPYEVKVQKTKVK
eukprot:TRINITY_DN2030_c0_g1_i20.p1 TRINITY_DN2030_c0_g1~~TRINITY_DN2030_c0_g1_i20.p1  ORF type:complete len:130 (+),score=28.69 TRINITY_DN2030_c0_g1_i20:65-454(+)